MEWFGLLDFFRFWEHFSAIFALQFIPRKGTETVKEFDKLLRDKIAIYPRKGTETACAAKPHPALEQRLS